jgi:hypothetical protein
MHGWVGHVRPNKSTVATTPINTAFKICFSRRKNEVLNRLPSEVMAGLGLLYLAKKVPHAATTPIVTAFKICISHRKKWALESPAGES